MGSEFETTTEIEVDAPPDEVWTAVATGPGIDSWFMGRSAVEPREGGTVRIDIGGFMTQSTVTAWDPPQRFAHQSSPGEDGSFMAFEYLIEGRDDGMTLVQLVHRGFLGGDGWEAEYDALRKGDPMYLATLGQYLTYFPGRTATPITARGPQQADDEHVWDGLKRGLGLTGAVAEGELARFSLDGSAQMEGVVDSVLFPFFLGVRTSDGLYRFVGRGGAVGTGHHIFADIDEKETERAWEAWLNQLFA